MENILTHPSRDAVFLGLSPDGFYSGSGVCADCLHDYGVLAAHVGWQGVWEDWTDVECYSLSCDRCHRDFARPTTCSGDCDRKCEVAHDMAVRNAEAYADRDR